MTQVRVECRPDQAGWSCSVTVGDDVGATHHQVSVSGGTLARIAPGVSEPTRLVEASFAFLLERERRESILRSFDLPL
ncbi:MAG TPA: hypothetical protein VES36_11490, partial [Candidatus Limnocylindrales bacterium]|nr:hypothetical protein [Candidatus Limnocylindrales bacterium]